ncbi:hypothetical protein ACKQTC_07205 [Peptococcus simiae]|uniref:Uncharacterized protein n=1 Tax=Peptococcus simiae TaxID=1643805 RepID=A0ABW9H0T6_9FIRM
MNKAQKRLLLVVAIIGCVILGFILGKILLKPPEVEAPKEEPTNETAELKADPKYTNDEVVQYNFGKGTLKAGLGKKIKDDHIYLNLDSDYKGNIGYYVESDRVPLELSRGQDQTADTVDLSKETNVIMRSPYYQIDLGPSRYLNEKDYGIRWQDDELYDGKRGGATINIRGIDRESGELLFIADLTISYNKETGEYRLDTLKSAEVLDKQNLSPKERDKALQEATDFVNDKLELDLPEGWEKEAKEKAICHMHEMTYFPRYLDTEKKVAYKRDITTCTNTVAVNLPLPPNRYGFVTVYFAPKTQLIGLEKPTAPGEDDLNLKLIGYDPIYPKNPQTAIAPPRFYD